MTAAERERLYRDHVGPDAFRRQQRAAASKCRSCQQPIRWVTVRLSGRKMPVDFDPHEMGNVVVDERGTAEVYRETPSAIPHGATLHYSHFATCPNADEHRKGR